jgi:hypothetical protein
MNCPTWHEVLVFLNRHTGPCTNEQRHLAGVAGIEFPAELPALIAGARLRSAFASSLGLDAERPSTDTQQELLDELRNKRDTHCRPPLNYLEADAWIVYLRLRQRQRALKRLRLEAGDVVTFANNESDLFEISSIRDDGKVFFRGGFGRRAWPDQLVVCARCSDNRKSATEKRQLAANQAAARAKTDRWSLAKQAELSPFDVRRRLAVDDIERLRTTIDTAADERPVQVLVENRPQLLTSLLGGSRRFCIPHARLGSEHVPDFLISEVDSLGVRWVLVELETPNAEVTLRAENQLDRHARKGLSQVAEWREWLQNNLAYARASRKDNGLGLPDIRSNSQGLVLVGRRSRLHPNSAQVRNPIREQTNVHIHTYDWWLEQLEGALLFVGPHAANPFILHHDRENVE